MDDQGYDAPLADLRDEERRALALAHERGYFEVPRRTTLNELAAALGQSDVETSEQLRRGIDAVLPTRGRQ